MKDSEILATVHRWMRQSIGREESVAVMGNRLVDCMEYIEEQWQLGDEHKEWQSEVFAKNDDGQQYTMDASEMERHRELEIGKRCRASSGKLKWAGRYGTITDLK